MLKTHGASQGCGRDSHVESTVSVMVCQRQKTDQVSLMMCTADRQYSNIALFNFLMFSRLQSTRTGRTDMLFTVHPE